MRTHHSSPTLRLLAAETLTFEVLLQEYFTSQLVTVPLRVEVTVLRHVEYPGGERPVLKLKPNTALAYVVHCG